MVNGTRCFYNKFPLCYIKRKFSFILLLLSSIELVSLTPWLVLGKATDNSIKFKTDI